MFDLIAPDQQQAALLVDGMGFHDLQPGNPLRTGAAPRNDAAPGDPDDKSQDDEKDGYGEENGARKCPC
ncbi:hypothetical protein [Afifella aestuarii]|uniref:hypothetical protein n=1 Tax=Afifella aestuarii TaxID=1909496 RepID=UPI001FE87EEA|nr:hypothetical protein [Afifella aestuarii]